MMSDVSVQVLKDVVITSLIVRATGRVEHLREYLEYTQDHNSGVHWKRMFNSSDCQFLPLFIAVSSGTRDYSTAYLERASMTAWLSAQFKESLPKAVTASPKSYSVFLENVGKN